MNSLPQANAAPSALTDPERLAIEKEMGHYEDPRAACIEALKIVQHHRGWVPDDAIGGIAGVLGIPASDVEGVATFYSQIFRQPVGWHLIVITSYSIHYTKLYEDPSRDPRPPRRAVAACRASRRPRRGEGHDPPAPGPV